MAQHSLEVVDAVAEPAVADADLAACEGGRAPTEAPCPLSYRPNSPPCW
jgi:hypothetical protein